MPKVYNRRTLEINEEPLPENSVYVGRPSKWGNPYRIREHSKAEQETVVRLFRESLTEEKKEDIRRELKGKNLICWCAPEACHADVLLEIANG